MHSSSYLPAMSLDENLQDNRNGHVTISKLNLPCSLVSLEMNPYFITASHQIMMNQLGGKFVNGKPLSREKKQRVIELAHLGFRASDISRQLKVTHGCISKLLAKYRTTGSIDTPRTHEERQRLITPESEQTIKQCTREQPEIFSLEMRHRMLPENTCSSDTTVSSVESPLQRTLPFVAERNTDPTEDGIPSVHGPQFHSRQENHKSSFQVNSVGVKDSVTKHGLPQAISGMIVKLEEVVSFFGFILTGYFCLTFLSIPLRLPTIFRSYIHCY